MRIGLLGLSLVVVGLLAPGLAQADWSKGDPYKMHFPQLPDPNGWDVNFTQPVVLADDWQCTQSGPVSDIHFWMSVHGGLQPMIQSVHASIHSNVPKDPTQPTSFSHPGGPLWDADFPATAIRIVLWPEEGPQGWFDPYLREVIQQDHRQIWQVNIVDIPGAFRQNAGEIYWLDLSVAPAVGTNMLYGWKTSLQHFEDDAVWSSSAAGMSWQELRDPITGESLDLAFVITPEPGTIALLGLGAAGLLRRRRNA
jgi:hypothetical protein